MIKQPKLTSFFVLLSSMIILFSFCAAAGAAEGVLHSPSGAVPRFPNLYIVGWTLVNFLLLLSLLYVFAFNPINNMLDQRSTTIASSMQYAEDIKLEVDEMRKEAQANLNEARRESQEIVNRAMKTAEEVKQEMMDKTHEEVANLRVKAQRDIENATIQAKQELREAAANLAILAAEKVLNHSITTDDHQAMIKEFINESGDRIC